MNKLKILLLLTLLSLLLISCKTNKIVSCDAYAFNQIEDTLITHSIPYVDTLTMGEVHVHFENTCVWVPKNTIVYKDTLIISFLFKKKDYVR